MHTLVPENTSTVNVMSATDIRNSVRSSSLVDNDVNSAECVDGILDDGGTIFYALDACNSLATSWRNTNSSDPNSLRLLWRILTSRDLVDYGSSGILRHVIDDDLGSKTSVHEGVRSSKTCTGACDDDDLVIESHWLRLLVGFDLL